MESKEDWSRIFLVGNRHRGNGVGFFVFVGYGVNFILGFCCGLSSVDNLTTNGWSWAKLVCLLARRWHVLVWEYFGSECDLEDLLVACDVRRGCPCPLSFVWAGWCFYFLSLGQGVNRRVELVVRQTHVYLVLGSLQR